jgi:two-component system sensor histidine kinase KdpD
MISIPRGPAGSSLVRAVGLGAVSLAATSGAVYLLEHSAGVPNASAAYLVAVVILGVTSGTIAAVSTAVGAFLLYNFLFVQPVHTLVVADPGEWLNLLLLLFVGVVVGRLSAIQRERAEAAGRREAEARALFRVSRKLALAASAEAALPELVAIVVSETSFRRAWLALGPGGRERIVADSEPGPAVPAPAVVALLQRRPGDEPAEWHRVHYSSGRPVAGSTEDLAHRIFIEAGGRRLGSLWASRPRAAGAPTREETRLVSATADQVGQALERDRLAGEALSAEVARQGDALKSALLDSVSHDLRTPLASIRAAAGSIKDPVVRWSPDDLRAAAETIDQEAERLSRLVTNLLDMSRIEAGALRADLQPFVLSDLVGDALPRLAASLGERRIEVDIAEDLPAVSVDALLMEQVLANVIENAARHTPSTSRIRIGGSATADGSMARLVIEDSGPGVPEAALPRLFDKFYRVEPSDGRSRRSSGVGLAVVRGLVEAMGGRVSASRSELGGVAISIELPIAARSVEPAGAAEDRLAS